MNERRILHALLRSDFTSFIHRTFLTIRPGEAFASNWHIDAIAWHLMQVYEGKIKRLIITIPPRHLKSIACSVALPAWVLGRDPTRKIICVSYADGLAGKHALDTRIVMAADWYRGCFPRTRPHPGKNTATEWVTTKQGFRLATSVGGTLTGRGGNLIILDDPHKPDEVVSDTRRQAVIDWYRSTLLSRLDSKRDDSIILIQQRLHEEDLAGYLLESGDWAHLNIPAIAEEAQSIACGPNRRHIRKLGDCLDPEREPREVLEKIRTELGSYGFAAQYQQQPAPLGGGFLKWAWFQTYTQVPKKEPRDSIVISWDCANKGDRIHDYSVGTVWLVKDKHYYLLQVVREQLEFPDLERRIVAVAEFWQAGLVLIEDQAAGTQLIQDLRRNSGLSIIDIIPKDDKLTRAMAVSPIIEGGRVWVPVEAPWLADFQREIVRFPKSRHDDQVDSLTQFLGWETPRYTFRSEDCFVAGPLKSAEHFAEMGITGSVLEEFGDPMPL